MSLEQALKENTAAVLALTAAYLNNGALTTRKANPAAEKPAADAPSAPVTLKYTDVSGPVNEFVKTHGREKALAVLKPFGLAKLTEAKPEQWGDILAAFQAAA